MKTIEAPLQELDEVWQAATDLVEGKSYAVSPHGDFNHVAQINGPRLAIVKTPRSITDRGLVGMFHREIGVADLLEVRLLEDKVDLGLEIPHLLGFSFDEEDHAHPPTRPWAAYSYVSGETLSATELRERLSVAEFAELGRIVGTFIFKTLNLVDMSLFRQRIDDYYTMCAADRLRQIASQSPQNNTLLHDKGYHRLADAVTGLYMEYHELREAIRPTGIGHDDLHAMNLRVSEDDSDKVRAVGIVDLANFKCSSPARELSFMALLHPAALRAAVETYETLSGESVDAGHVDFWYRLRCTMRCMRVVQRDKPIRPEALFGMQQAWPEIDWRAEFADRIAA